MLFNIYKKEMIDSFRDKRTLLLTVILPILMMTALTFYYENMISGGSDEVYLLAVETTISTEQEKVLRGMTNVELLATDDPMEAVSEGEAQAAILFEGPFDENLQSGEVANVTIIGDSFSQNSSTLMQTVSVYLMEYGNAIATERLQAEGINPDIIEPLVISQEEVSADDSNLMLLALLIPMILSVAIGVGAAPSAADLFAGEKEKKTMEALLMTPVNRSKLLLAKFLTIGSIGSIIGVFTLVVIALEIMFLTEHLRAAVDFGENTIPVIGFSLLLAVVFAFFLGSILVLTSIVGKTVKEAQSYASPIMMLAIFPIMLLGGLGVNEYTTNHFILPFINIFTIITELVFGIVNYQHILLVIGSNIVYIIVLFIIARFLFSKDKWVMD